MNTSPVRLITVGPGPLAVVRRRASQKELSSVVPDGCGSVWNFLRQRQVAGVGRHVALYWDNAINLDVGVELDTTFVSDGNVIPSATPGGLVATLVHMGPYQRLIETHQAIRLWCAGQSYELAGPSWEIYGHWEEEWNRDPSKIRTDVFYLVRPKGSS